MVAQERNTSMHTEAFKKARPYAVMWYEIGQGLGIDDGVLDDLKVRVSSGDEDSEKKLDEVLYKWIEKERSPTLEDLDSVLRKVHYTMVIRRICKWLKKIVLFMSLTMLLVLIVLVIAVSIYFIIEFLKIPSEFDHFRWRCRNNVHLYSNALIEKYNSNTKDTSYLRASNVPVVPYVSLTMVRKENISETTSADLMMAAVVGGANKVTEMRDPIEFNDLFKPVSEEKLKFILITGAPGIGKSTLALEIARNSQNYSVSLLLTPREGDVKETDDLFIEDGLNHIDIESVKGCIGHANGEGVLWIVDGFDELPLHQQMNTDKSIIHKLLQNRIFADSTIVITSRPSSTTLFTEYLNEKSSKHIEIVGFNDSQLEHYVSQRFMGDNNTALRLNFTTYYKEINPALHAMMSIPLNAAIVTSLYECTYQYTHSNRGQPIYIPHTQTGLYNALVINILLRHQRMQGQPLDRSLDRLMIKEDIEKLPSHLQAKLMKLTKIAFTGIVKDIYIFNDSYLFTKFRLRSSKFDHLDLMNKVTARRNDGLLIPRYMYHFLHTTLQEYLAAIYYLYSGGRKMDHPAKIGVFVYGISSVLQKEQVNYTILNQIVEESFFNVSNCLYFYEFQECGDMSIHFNVMNWLQVDRQHLYSNAFKCGYLLANYHSTVASTIMLADSESIRMFILGLTSTDRTNDNSMLGKIKKLELVCGENSSPADIVKVMSIAKADDLYFFIQDAQCISLMYKPKGHFYIGVDYPELIKQIVKVIEDLNVTVNLFITTNLTADLLTSPNILHLSIINNASEPLNDFNETVIELLASKSTVLEYFAYNNYCLSQKTFGALLSVKNSISNIIIPLYTAVVGRTESFYRSYWCLFLNSLFNPLTATYLSIDIVKPEMSKLFYFLPAVNWTGRMLLWMQHPVKDLQVVFTVPKTCFVLTVGVNQLDAHNWDYFVDLLSVISNKNCFINRINFVVVMSLAERTGIEEDGEFLSDFLLLLAQFVKDSKKPLTAINVELDPLRQSWFLATMLYPGTSDYHEEIYDSCEKLVKAARSKPYFFDVLFQSISLIKRHTL